MEYQSAIKKNKRLPFAAKWMDLEIIILSEVSQRQISYDIICMCNLKKKDTNELTYKIIDPQTQKANYGYQRGKGVVIN